MKAGEFKLRLISGINNLIDAYYGTDSRIDKLMNATLRLAVRQKSYMIDDALELFTDKDGCIDKDVVIEEYSKILGGDKFVLDIRNFINNDLIKNLLPDKALIIKTDDLIHMLA